MGNKALDDNLNGHATQSVFVPKKPKAWAMLLHVSSLASFVKITDT